MPQELNQDEGRPVLEWLLREYPQTPRGRAKQWILAGRVSVCGVVLRKPHEVIPDPGQRLELQERRATTLACGAGWVIHPRVTLVYLDGALAVVNKGAGLISVPAPNSGISALSIVEDFLAGRLKAWERGATGRTVPPVYRRLEPLPVHRLDKFTSGLFCMALNPPARANLIDQLRAHTMRREYVAFVEGRSPAPRGTWRQWLELSEDELRQHVLSEAKAGGSRSDAREAITHYEVLSEYPLAGGGFVTKLRLRLETGRKHQIRVQAANANLPLVGDRTYHPKCRSGSREGMLIAFPRQALHAETLALEHPQQPGKQMSWKAGLPKDMVQLEASLRAGQAALVES
jgi:23S rRNA pseudouridine1911/1915/1917 synthase